MRKEEACKSQGKAFQAEGTANTLRWKHKVYVKAQKLVQCAQREGLKGGVRETILERRAECRSGRPLKEEKPNNQFDPSYPSGHSLA